MCVRVKQHHPKLGEAVVVVWKKENGIACGGTEGFVLGIAGDEVSGEYLVLDRSTYHSSFKSNVLSLGILDLKVVSMNDVESIEKADIRRHPPGIDEKFTMIIEVNYKSNIDFNSTWCEIQKRSDCKVYPIRKPESEAEYGMNIKEISALEGVSITISCEGTLQIFCQHDRLDDCIKWIRETVELLPSHKRLVLIPTKITYKMHDTYKEEARPTDEVINRIAGAQEGPPVIFPIGWAHRFFVELDENPLQGLFPGCQPLENFVMRDKDGKDKRITHPLSPKKIEQNQFIDLNLSQSGVNSTRYLGSCVPLIRLKGKMPDASPKYDEYFIKRWLEARSAPWQWFSSDQISGKMTLRDLNIDKKARVWTLDLRKYSSSDVE